MKEDTIENLIFSWPSVILHTLIFIVWFYGGWSTNLLTNIVSLEAIYITLLIGLGQRKKHDKMIRHINKLRSK